MARRTRYTEEETNFIIANYPTKGARWCAEVLGKSRIAIEHRVTVLRLKRDYNLVKSNSSLAGHKLCPGCKQILPHSDFCMSSQVKSKLNPRCKKCQIAYYRKYRERMSPERQRKFRVKKLMYSAKGSAKKNGYNFNLDENWINQRLGFTCPVLDFPYDLTSLKGIKWKAPSIDRIDSNKGYTKDNCIIVSCQANTIKNAFLPEEVSRVGKYYENLLEERTIEYFI